MIAFSLLCCERVSDIDFEKIEYVNYNHQLFEEDVKMGELIRQVSRDFETTPKQMLSEIGYDEQQSKRYLTRLTFMSRLQKITRYMV